MRTLGKFPRHDAGDGGVAKVCTGGVIVVDQRRRCRAAWKWISYAEPAMKVIRRSAGSGRLSLLGYR